MDLGKEVIAACLHDKSALKQFIESGFDMAWLTDKTDLSRAAIFGDDTAVDAYRFVLNSWETSRRPPSPEYFRHSFPAQSFRLPAPGLPVSELLAMAQQNRTRVWLEVLGSSFIDLHEEERYEDALTLLESEVRRIRRTQANGRVCLDWDALDYDIETRLDRQEKLGIHTGIRELDQKFAGWQTGELITYLGRAKACKTSHLIKSALQSYLDGFSVLLVSVEINAASIADRCDAFLAGIEYESYVRGHLSRAEKDLVRDARAKLRDEEGYFRIIQPAGQYTLSDLEADFDRANSPDVVYIDGFYFLTDQATKKPGSNWEGHDNLARELKEMALRRGVTIVTTMQVREKQTRRGGLDDNAMMGGTGLIMASDMVLTFDMDKEDGTNTIACSRSRTRELPTVCGTWHWKTSTFRVRDEGEWSAGEDDDE